MKHNLVVACITCLFLFSSCASELVTIQNQKRIAQVTSWQFVYSSRITAPAIQSESSRNPGQAKSELEFPQTIFNRLQNRFNVPVTNDTSQVRAQIRLQAVMLPSGVIKCLNVALYDVDSQLLAKTVVPNDRAQQNSFTYDDSFAQYATDKIAELLNVQPNPRR